MFRDIPVDGLLRLSNRLFYVGIVLVIAIAIVYIGMMAVSFRMSEFREDSERGATVNHLEEHHGR